MPRAEKRVTQRTHIKAASSGAASAPHAGDSSVAPSKTKPAATIPAANPNDHLQIAGSKKDKRVNRRELWLEKMGGLYSARSKADKKKQKRDLFGVAADLEDISTALDMETAAATVERSPTNVDKSAEASQKAKTSVPKKKAVSQSARRLEGVNEMLRLQSIIAHKSFKASPLDTIRTHLKNTI
ncbi:hypothetical protein HDU81_010613 [Chytriomyces hyalinus]|nr:hypothetical protein HDU81_010613 [Chytriomyces hyalinus]